MSQQPVAWPSILIPILKYEILKYAILLLLLSTPAIAQQGATDLGPRLLQDAAVRAAVEAAERNEPQILEEQIHLCEIPAPPFKEQRRAEAYKQAFEELGLKSVRIDAEGNVLGDRPGLAERPRLVFSAHLDTVFPEGTDVRVRREGSLLRGPGIGDDCRGLAVVLGLIRALKDAGVQTPGTITFVGTMGEEGLVNPIHALGRAIGAIADIQVPARPKTTFNSNIPMSLGIPAITIDGGGRGTGAHSLGESFDSTESWKGTQRAVLVAIALAQR